MGKIKPVRQFILREGQGQYEYEVQFDSFRFSVRKVSMPLPDGGINDHPVLRLLADVLEKTGRVIADEELITWGFSRKQLMRTRLKFNEIQKGYYPMVEHPAQCTKCGGKCCGEVKTSGQGMEDIVVGPLRWFEVQQHDSSNIFIAEDKEGIHAWVDHSYIKKPTPFLRKKNGVCVYLDKEKGCSAPVKPLMCSQFSCMFDPISKVREKLSDADLTEGWRILQDAERAAVDYRADRLIYLSGYCIVSEETARNIENLMQNLPEEDRERFMKTLNELTRCKERRIKEYPGSSSTKVQGGLMKTDSEIMMDAENTKEGHRGRSLIAEQIEKAMAGEKIDDGPEFTTTFYEIPYPDTVKKYMIDFPVLSLHIKEMPEVIDMLMRLPEDIVGRFSGLIAIFNYILCRGRAL